MTPVEFPERLALIGVGNALRGDDGVGLEIVRRLREPAWPRAVYREITGDCAAIIAAWENAAEALVFDAAHSGAAPGTIHRFEAHRGPLPAEMFRTSTHLLGLAEAVELARQLRALPPRLVIYGIEGACFEAGSGLSLAVERAAAAVVRRVRAERFSR
jgi:hydrogenase maturation protease